MRLGGFRKIAAGGAMNRPTRRVFVGLVSTLAAAAMPAFAAEAIKIGMTVAMSRPGSVSLGVKVSPSSPIGGARRP